MSSPFAVRWQDVIEAVKPAVVALQITAVRSFHDTTAGLRAGTGFVVNKEAGLILTNRQLVSCGPVRGVATFVGCVAMEEVPVEVAYVDPTHDFAFLRFDACRLKRTNLVALELDASGFHVGQEVCMLGNDSMERLQILQGSIARVDRNVPELPGDYCDENTFYILACTGSCGGSASGSPIINKEGCVVALYVTGLVGAMHAFCLPLQRIVRAHKLLQSGKAVPRGSLCIEFTYKTFPECRRLGVSESFVQHHVLGREETLHGTFSRSSPPGGMLVVRKSLPGEPAEQVVISGDVLLEVNGLPCVDFAHLEDMLDEKVGTCVSLSICRAGQHREIQLAVRDLHSLIPRSFVELALGVLHGVPYQTAMKHHIPLKGVYVAQPGFVLGQAVPSDVIISAINGAPCHDIESLTELLQGISDNEYFSVTWTGPSLGKSRHRCEDYVKMQRQWSLFTAWDLHRQSHSWVPRELHTWRGGGACVDSDDSTTASLSDGAFTADESTSSEDFHESAGTQLCPSPPKTHLQKMRMMPSGEDPCPPAKKAKLSRPPGAMAALGQSICAIVFKIVQNLDLDVFPGGWKGERDIICLHGAGIVIDAARGLILTDRGTVPQRLADIEVTLGMKSRSASVFYMHPDHSIVVLKLDEDSDMSGCHFGKSAIFEERDFEAGDQVDFVGVDGAGRKFNTEVTVQAVRLGKFPRHWPPRWCEKNLDAVILVDDPQNTTSGVLCDADGNIHALYSVVQAEDQDGHWSCGYGIPLPVLQPVLNHLARPEGAKFPPAVPSLGIDFQHLPLQNLQRLPARIRPSSNWLGRLSRKGGKVLQVSSVMQSGPCHGKIRVGDIVVAVQDRDAASVSAIEAELQDTLALASARQLSAPSNIKVTITVLRSGAQHEVELLVPLLSSDGSTRVLLWHGLLLQEAPRTVRDAQHGPATPSGVHISQTLLGSPADTCEIPGALLIAVNGQATPTLDAVLALTCTDSHTPDSLASSACGAPCCLRIELADMAGRRFVSTLEPDPLYWPVVELSQDPNGSWSSVERRR
jgi:S1-C subfamily serine protease